MALTAIVVSRLGVCGSGSFCILTQEKELGYGYGVWNTRGSVVVSPPNVPILRRQPSDHPGALAGTTFPAHATSVLGTLV